jgi:cobalt-zinc-cadmium efflux system membrane fusion protein
MWQSKNVVMRMAWAVVLLGFVSGCSQSAAPAGTAGKEKEAEAEGGAQELSVAEVLKTRCSHGLTLECDECRYEVGVVKVPAALVAPAAGQSTGLVKTIQVSRQKVATALLLTGALTLNENATVHISPRLPGMIRTVAADVGAQVKAEEVLFTLESVEVGAALGEYQKNLTLSALADKTYRREKQLFEQKAGTEGEMIEAQIRLEELQAAGQDAARKLRMMGFAAADLAPLGGTNQASWGDALAVRAPFGGTILEKHGARGELVEPGKDVMLLADLDTVWAWGALHERDLATVLARRATGGALPVELTVPAFPGRVFTGAVNYVSGVMDESTRTIRVRTVVANPAHLLRPGMFCDMRLLLTTDEEVLAVPRSAVLSDMGAGCAD